MAQTNSIPIEELSKNIANALSQSLNQNTQIRTQAETYLKEAE
jgi:hypothetical protein